MCNHTYMVSPFKRCPYPEVYESARRVPWALPEDPRSLELPLDASGACIFHSRDLDWKRKYDLPQRFRELLQLLERAQTQVYDFGEFVFVGTELRKLPAGEETILRLHDLTIREHADFCGATFVDTLELNAVKIKGAAAFGGATFLRDLIVLKSSMTSLSFSGAALQGKFRLEDVDCIGNMHFDHARFTCTYDGSVVSFQSVSVRGVADLSDASFILGKESAVVFQFVAFHDMANFRNAKFHCHVKFDNVGFMSTAEFIDTSFTGLLPFHAFGVPLPHRRGGVQFTDINVGPSGVLTFMSTDPRTQVFDHDVEFRLWEESTGMVRFENVNFNRLRDESRKELIRLAKEGRVEIGAGCIKYRFQTGIRTIFVDRGNAPLVLELCHTFTSYFTASNGINLGFEVVERDASKVSFFYFTDEDISEIEFLERLAHTERQLWNLLSNGPTETSRALEASAGTAMSAGGRSALINAVDGVSALIGTLFRAGVRIAVGAWKESDTRSLLAAIRFNDEGAEERALSLHKALVDRYTGQSLFGFSHEQNRLLPPMAEIARPRPANAKVTILFLGANSSRSPLELEVEVSKIQENLKLARERENLVLKQEWAVSVDSLLQALLDESPTIVHFSGHGTESGIILNDLAGEPREVTAEALSDLFRLFKDTVRCIVLNSCYSEHQAHAIRQHIPYVIGMRAKIPDSAAIAFSTGFYKAIGAGRDVPFAFDMGEVRMRMEGFEGETIPILI